MYALLPTLNVLIIIAALAFLMFVAYRGYSVILFAPVAALLAVLCTDPTLVAPLFTGLFMAKMAAFAQNYLPVFLLGALFGKLIEISGFSRSIVEFVIRIIGPSRAMLCIVTVAALLTYGGVSLFVVIFAVYPFAAEMFRQSNIPKRLIPATVALGAFTFTMDALPGSPQIQNIIPTKYFSTTTWAAPWLGLIGSLIIIALGFTYLEWRRRSAAAKLEGYGENHTNEPESPSHEFRVNPFIALLPLLIVALAKGILTYLIHKYCGESLQLSLEPPEKPIVLITREFTAIWAVEAALILGILTVIALGFRAIKPKFAHASKAAVSGALLASMNTAAEYGFGAVIAVLPGFIIARNLLQKIHNPLVNEAITVTTLAGITGSASGGMGIALAAMKDQFIASANAAHIPLEVFHRIAAMASGGMDTLPHNGAVITLLAVTGLTHRQSYRDIFAITGIKTLTVFIVIAIYYATGIV